MRTLHREYREADLGNLPDPIDELVYISLTRQTHRQNAMRTWQRVKIAGGPPALIKMPTRRLAGLIKDGGFSQQKARWIREALRRIEKEMGHLSLQPTSHWSDEEVEAFLCSLPGIKIKSAKCVMLYSMARQVLPVDTHLRRIAERVGVVPRHLSEKRIHERLEQLVRPRDRLSLHVNAIWHGRAVCTALRPACTRCQVRAHCDLGRRTTVNG